MTYPTAVQEDLNAAKYLLNKHGFAFKIFGRDDVIRVLRDNHGTLPTAAEDNIVKHVMEGDDWPTMSDHSNWDENNLIAIIEGTQHDHPEWFQKREEYLQEKAKAWIYAHGIAVYDDIEKDVADELNATHDEAVEIVNLVERAVIRDVTFS